jgi:hypothetical protein
MFNEMKNNSEQIAEMKTKETQYTRIIEENEN